MALTIAQQSTTMPRITAEQLAHHLPQPTPDQLLQREIEDTLMLISALPETTEKVMIDLGDGIGTGWFEIQCNQLELFMKLEGLVEQFSPEQKRGIIDGLHPAMSVQERVALKLVLERGLRRVDVPRPLNVRKVVRKPAKEGDDEEREMAAGTVEKPSLLTKEGKDGLRFPELTSQEMSLRRRELDAERDKQAGIFDPASSHAGPVTLDSRKRRQEIANMFASAAKKLQDGSAGLESQVYSQSIKEGLQMIKSASSALRAYTDASPREVVVRQREEAVRSSQDTPRSSEQLPDVSAQSTRASEGTVQASEPKPQLSNEIERRPSTSSPRQSENIAQPSRHEDQPIPIHILRSKVSTPITQAPSDRPHSDPTTSSCPWPETWFTAPRCAAPPPRSVSLPQAPPRPPPKTSTTSTLPTTTLVTKSLQQGSISAARAGIADRQRREQMDVMKRNLPYARSSAAKTWALAANSTPRPAEGDESLGGVAEEDGCEIVEERSGDDEETTSWREV